MITFSDQVVLSFLAEWLSSAQAPPTTNDRHSRFNVDPFFYKSWQITFRNNQACDQLETKKDKSDHAPSHAHKPRHQHLIKIYILAH